MIIFPYCHFQMREGGQIDRDRARLRTRRLRAGVRTRYSLTIMQNEVLYWSLIIFG